MSATIVAVGAVALVWALWPLSDPRFDWKPYYLGFLDSGDCKSAIRLLARGLAGPDLDAARLAVPLSTDARCKPEDWSPREPARFRGQAENLLQFADDPAAKNWPSVRKVPGWRGVWVDRKSVWFSAVTAFQRYAKKHPGVSAIDAPIAVVTHLRCLYALRGRPGAYYFKMRTLPARDHGFDELRQDDWEWRALRCADRPAVGGIWLYHPQAEG